MINKKEVEAANTLQLGVMLDAFARSITDKTSFLSPGEMGLRDVRIIEAIYASVKQGGARVELRL
jgi:glucose-fructose oxidoreductase